MFAFALRGALVLALLVACPLRAETVNVYSSRHYGGDAELWAAFKARTGIEVKLLEAKSAALLSRLETEAQGSPADLLIVTDAANLGKATELQLFQPTPASELPAGVPAEFAHPEGHWFGLGRRHRVMVYHPERVAADNLPSYLELAEPAWRGRIAVRSSGNIYNQSLLAAMISHHGKSAAEQWAAGVVANMARRPQGNDRAQVAAVAAGQADIAIINHYYYGKMLESSDPAQAANARAVKLYFPDQGPGQAGAHTNVTGAGVLRHAPNPSGARKLLAFLLSPEGQALFVGPSGEFPIRKDVDVPSGFPDFRADDLPVAELARYNSEAVRIFDRVGWR